MVFDLGLLPSGCRCGLKGRLITAEFRLLQVHGGTLDLYTTGKNGPMLAGNLTSILSSGIIHVTLSLLYPEVGMLAPIVGCCRGLAPPVTLLITSPEAVGS
jgi:hypothetical protein